MAAEWIRRSRICFGVAVICGLFLVETAVAHRTVPHPASPFVWTLLGVAGVGAAVAGAALRWRARRVSGESSR